jgi:anti-sigma B factor antagonist
VNHRIERHGGATVFIASGRLDFSAAAGFQSQLDQIIGTRDGTAALIVDCAELEYVSSAGLRAFLLAARNCQRGGRYFAACTLQHAVREVFELSGFGQLIPLHADRTTALAAVAAPRA